MSESGWEGVGNRVIGEQVSKKKMSEGRKELNSRQGIKIKRESKAIGSEKE